MPFWQFFRNSDVTLHMHENWIVSAHGSVPLLIYVNKSGIISKSIHIFFILGLYKFLVSLECISINGLSFSHSDCDPSSVTGHSEISRAGAASLSLVSCYIVANYLDPFSSVIEQAINVLLISWSPWVASGPGVTFSLVRA